MVNGPAGNWTYIVEFHVRACTWFVLGTLSLSCYWLFVGLCISWLSSDTNWLMVFLKFLMLLESVPALCFNFLASTTQCDSSANYWSAGRTNGIQHSLLNVIYDDRSLEITYILPRSVLRKWKEQFSVIIIGFLSVLVTITFVQRHKYYNYTFILMNNHLQLIPRIIIFVFDSQRQQGYIDNPNVWKSVDSSESRRSRYRHFFRTECYPSFDRPYCDI